MKSLLQGKSVLVTGAARGIGLAVAEAIIAAGGTVAMADIDEAEVRAQARRLNSIAVVMDVSDNGAVKSGVEQAAKALGTIDGLVNNAAMLDESHAALVTEHRFEKVISTNLTSILRVAQRVLPYLSQSGGSIVNTLSTQAMFGQANSVAYATAKGGGLNLTRAMAIDLAPVRVNAVATGFIDTRMAMMSAGATNTQLTGSATSTLPAANYLSDGLELPRIVQEPSFFFCLISPTTLLANASPWMAVLRRPIEGASPCAIRVLTTGSLRLWGAACLANSRTS